MGNKGDYNTGERAMGSCGIDPKSLTKEVKKRKQKRRGFSINV